MHVTLIEELFSLIQSDIDGWNELIMNKLSQGSNKKNTEDLVLKELSDIITSNQNENFVYNVIHIISQMSDNIILACGGILPILASATSPNYELDVIQSSQGLSLKTAWRILDKFIGITQVLIFKSTLSVAGVEEEKGFESGTVLRQMLRQTVLCGIRNCIGENLFKF